MTSKGLADGTCARDSLDQAWVLDKRKPLPGEMPEPPTSDLTHGFNFGDGRAENSIEAGVQENASHCDPRENSDEHERIESLVRARTAQLTELAAHLYRVREDERRALARELHDELGSLLTAAKLDLGFIKSKCVAANPALLDKCTRLADMLDQAMAFKRRVIDELRPSTLDMLGLSAATRELV